MTKPRDCRNPECEALCLPGHSLCEWCEIRPPNGPPRGELVLVFKAPAEVKP